MTNGGMPPDDAPSAPGEQGNDTGSPAGGTTSAAPPPPPPPPPPLTAPRPLLRRSLGDRKIAGVAGGLGRYFDIDPLIFRVVLVVLAIFGGSGLLLYAIGWLLIPDEGADESDAQRLVNGRGTPKIILAVVLAIVGIAAVSHLLDTGVGFGGLVALAAIGLAALLISRTEGPPREPAPGPASGPLWPSAPPPPPPPAAGAYGQTQGTAYSSGPPFAAAPAATAAYPTATFGAVPPASPVPPAPLVPPAPPARPMPPGGYGAQYQPPPPPAPPRRKKDRSRLGGITVSVALLVTGLLIAWDLATTSDVSVPAVLATALGIVGLGLLVGAFVGRARGLIILGVILAVATTVTAAIDVNPHGGTGDRYWAPSSAAAVHSPYRLGAGHADLDLTAATLAADDYLHVDASVGAGELVVTVPRDVDLVVNAHAGVGNLDLPGNYQPGGFDVDRRYVDRSRAGGLLQLDLKVGLGQVEVRRAAA